MTAEANVWPRNSGQKLEKSQQAICVGPILDTFCTQHKTGPGKLTIFLGFKEKAQARSNLQGKHRISSV